MYVRRLEGTASRDSGRRSCMYIFVPLFCGNICMYGYVYCTVLVHTWGDRVDTACYSLFREREIKKNDAICIEFAMKTAENREKTAISPMYICTVKYEYDTNLCEVTRIISYVHTS